MVSYCAGLTHLLHTDSCSAELGFEADQPGFSGFQQQLYACMQQQLQTSFKASTMLSTQLALADSGNSKTPYVSNLYNARVAPHDILALLS